MDDFFPFIYIDNKKHIEQMSLFIEIEDDPEYKNIPEIEEEKVSIIDIL